MRRVMQAIALSGVFALPAFAQDGGMAKPMTLTCAQFMAMDSEGRTMAVEQMRTPAEEMATDKMMPEDMASDKMTSAGESMMAEDMVAAVLQACEGKPDLMVMDAMMEMTGK